MCNTNSFSFLVLLSLSLILAACSGELAEPEIAKKICAATDGCNSGGSDSFVGADNGPDIAADTGATDDVDTSPDLKQADEDSDSGTDTVEVDGGGELPSEKDTADAPDVQVDEVAPDGDSELPSEKDMIDAEDTLDTNDGNIDTDQDSDATVLPDTPTTTEPDTDASTVDGEDIGDASETTDQVDAELPPPDADAKDEGVDVGPETDGSDTGDTGEDADVPLPTCVSNQACDDGNPCTDNTCDTAKGCVSVPNTATCTDNDICTEGDTCKDKVCVGKIMICDDGNTCTTDSCDKAGGCTKVPNTAACDDGNACTDSKCDNSTCKSNSPTVCDDKSVCTTDSCDPKTGGCVYENICSPLFEDPFSCSTGLGKWEIEWLQTETGAIWNVDNKPVAPPDSDCTLNFNNQKNFCGLSSCDGSEDWQNPNASAGSATYPVEINASKCKGVKVAFNSYANVQPSVMLWLQVSTSNFAGCDATTNNCQQVTKGCAAGTASYLVSKAKLKEWMNSELNFPGGSTFRIRFRFASCTAQNGPDQTGWFIDNLKVTCLK